MAKPQKRKQRRRSTSAPRDPHGFDYGCLPYAMAVSAFEFIEHLTRASPDIVAYGSVWSEAVKATVPTISLVGLHGNELSKAFEQFHAWSSFTDADSVELTFVFQKSGGYVLAIGPEYHRLERRCLGFDRTHRVIAVGPAWFKQLDSVNPMLLQFREYCSSPIAPFMFYGGVYTGPRGVFTESSMPEIRTVPGLAPLLKFEATFVDEDQVVADTMGWAALNIGKGTLTNSARKGPPTPQPADIAKQRFKALRSHFPVSLERARRLSTVPEHLRQLDGKGIPAWQVEQAICNLTLSRDMGAGEHFVGVGSRTVETKILRALGSRYEMADQQAAVSFSTDQVVTQLIADGNALLRQLEQKPASTVDALQAALNSLSALEAPSVTSEIAPFS